MASNVQQAQSCYWADKRLPFAHFDNAHLSILTLYHFLHLTQLPLSEWSILINNKHYIPKFKAVLRLSPLLADVKG